MKRDRRIAGLGGVVFGALVIVALSIANPQAGSYHVADVSAFVAQGHRNAAVLSSALIAIAVFGLIALMAYLCDTYLEEGTLKPDRVGIQPACRRLDSDRLDGHPDAFDSGHVRRRAGS